MNPFLKTIAQHYYQTLREDIDNYCFVFPNRRSALFFKKHLSSVCDKPLFAPDTFTINELFARLSPLRQADTLGLIFSLYKHYIDISGLSESFDEFYSWGETLLSDFNDIDKYLIDAEQLFSNLYNIKAIDNSFDYLSAKQIAAIKRFWKDFEADKYTGNRQNFLQSWLVLAPLYKAFKEDLNLQNNGYEGMIYRSVAEQVKDQNLPQLPYKRIVFVGLNALNGCEKVLLKHYQNLGIADFHWDFQSDFIKDPQNKAGFFITENLIHFPQSPKLNFEVNIPNFESISIPSNTGQTKIIGDLLKSKNIKDKAQIEDTAIILSDEQLMLPMLHALPDDIEAYNITMGYSLRATSIYTFFSQLLNLQKNTRISDDKITFYHKNVMSILRHSFIGKHFKEDSNRLSDLLIKNNLIYATSEMLQVNPVFNLIFTNIETPGDFPTYLKRIFAACIERYFTSDEDDDTQTTNDERLEKEFLYHLYITISRFDDLLQQYDVTPGIDVLVRLLRKHIDTISVPFNGEPLKGLQIMGILETRTLDFENLVFLSFNEGIFPKAVPANSFIPHNLRYGFGLPTIEHQDAVFAYYFYRIIQRAKNVWMVYDASDGGLKHGEISRYFSQLKYIYNQPITERMQTYKVEFSTPKPIVIQKDDSIMAKLNHYLSDSDKKLSASALNDYIDCKLKFYFKKVENIKEKDELKEDIDGSSFGTIFHSVMENLYLPYENTTLTKKLIYEIQQNGHEIDRQINDAFAKEHFKTEMPVKLKGRHLIVARIIKKYVKQFLKIDMDTAPFIYRKGEQKVSFQFPFNNNKTVNFIGYIDRVDEVNGKTRIIDYKTGRDKRMVFDSIEELTTDSKNRPAAVFQTFFYAWMYAKAQGNRSLTPNVFYLRNLFKNTKPVIKNGKEIVDDFSNYYEDFEKLLTALIEDIFNPDVPFTQTEIEEHCSYCDYKDICLK